MQLHSFLISTTDTGKRATQRYGGFTPRERIHGAHRTRNWADPRAGLEVLLGTLPHLFRESKPESSSW